MTAIIIFLIFIFSLFGFSWYLSKKSKSVEGFLIASGQIHWFINGIALTGGYLSAASFLGICGMIAFTGFDGYLYSIGFLSGWIAALFIVAEPLRRLGKYTFADALGSRFKSKNIHLAASISTLTICICYLIPQMVGAGVLIEPLLGISHFWGVILVGAVVIVVVASAGMTSTTYVQFIKASMLILFSFIVVLAVCLRGIQTQPETRDIKGNLLSKYSFREININLNENWKKKLETQLLFYKDRITSLNNSKSTDASQWLLLEDLIPLNFENNKFVNVIEYKGKKISLPFDTIQKHKIFLEVSKKKKSFIFEKINFIHKNNMLYVVIPSWWEMKTLENNQAVLYETQNITKTSNGTIYINGLPSEINNNLLAMGKISKFSEENKKINNKKNISPFKFLSVFADKKTHILTPKNIKLKHKNNNVSIYYNKVSTGNKFMRPGGKFKLSAGNFWSRLDFISLMIALFFGTSALPHVLIRYYTVKDSMAARKSTIVAISAIGLFYILTLFLGLGAIVNGVLNPLNDNMSAPLLARAFGEVMFAIITALAFATVLGTVAGLIVAASGAVANDFLDHYLKLSMSDKTKVLAAKITAVSVGVIAVVLGIIFKNINVGFLVGWAFAVAASANFPAIIMVLFWKKTTPTGIISSIIIGIIFSLGIILLGPDMFELYGFGRNAAWIPLGQPAIFAMPISFLTIIIVSVFTQHELINSEINK
jgi:cation/acetate symporter